VDDERAFFGGPFSDIHSDEREVEEKRERHVRKQEDQEGTINTSAKKQKLN
jgi:hypothetical protein